MLSRERIAPAILCNGSLMASDLSLFDGWPFPILDWHRCWRCGEEIAAPPVGFIEQTAYGWCCHRCLVELPPDEYNALLSMNDLAGELIQRGLSE